MTREIISTFLWGSIISATILCATDDDRTLLEQAHTYYKTHEYKAAQELYNKSSSKGAAVWYNLGNCAYHLHDYGSALIYWQRAYNYAPLSLQSWCRYNSRRAREQLGIVVSSDEETSREIVMRYIHQLPILLLQCIVLILWYCLWLYGRQWYERRCIVQITSITFALSMALFLLAVRYTKETTHTLFVARDAPVYVGPSETFPILATIPAYTIVTKEQHREKQWYKVKAPELRGWIAAEQVVPI